MGETVINFSISTFVETYIFLLYFATIIICGWFAATRGWAEVQPDGSIKKCGKILKWWYFFWYKETGKISIYYTDERLFQLQDNIHKYTKILKENLEVYSESILNRRAFYILVKNEHVDKVIEAAKNYDAIGYNSPVPEGNKIKFYKEEPKYYFPEWVRHMMAGCITCHATFYGNIIFWMFVFMVKYTSLSQELFDFTILPTIYFIGVWMAYWLSLAYTCSVAYKKMP